MQYITDINPASQIIERESTHILLSFCTFCTLLKGKKLSYQNVFIIVLQDEKIRNILKDLLDIDSTVDIIKIFIEFDPTITKSKYVTKYINSQKGTHVNRF